MKRDFTNLRMKTKMAWHTTWQLLSLSLLVLGKLLFASMSLSSKQRSTSPLCQSMLSTLPGKIRKNSQFVSTENKLISRWNMPTASVEDLGDDYFRTTYDRSMTMSTYILAIVISDYDFSESSVSPVTGTQVTGRLKILETWLFNNNFIYCQKLNLNEVAGPSHIIQKGLGKYGRQISEAIIDGYSEYYGYNYADSFNGQGGAKSDQFGIPDFAAGAMENWGLVTYKMGLAYNDPESFPEALNVQVATVYCHELSHQVWVGYMHHFSRIQWTGNLVTTTWWDEIWIHESFADLGGFLGLRWAEKTWNWENEFVNSQFMNGLRVDAR